MRLRASTPWLLIVCWLAACNQSPQHQPEPSWRGVLQLSPEVELPFLFTWQPDRDSSLIIRNGEESIVLFPEDIQQKGDSLRLNLPVFGSYFLVKQGENAWSGEYREPSRGTDYRIPFRAMPARQRFPRQPADNTDLATLPTRWAVTFSPGTEGAYPAVGVFETNGAVVSGTFLTETGDYRFLEGYRSADSLFLSGFDGAHAFLFQAALGPDSLKGAFYSGNHWQEPWVAVPDAEASLRAADSLTFLRPGYEHFQFAFPNLAGDTVRFPQARYHGKVVVVQLLGSWCPNCMDETRLLAQWHDQYQPEGLEVIGLAFERWPTFEDAAAAVQRMRKRLEADYPMLIASLSTSKSIAADKLPMLNHVLSYPTTIWIDRAGNIRIIHTGFNGPGTGEPYQAFVEEYQALLEEMLAEPAPP